MSGAGTTNYQTRKSRLGCGRLRRVDSHRRPCRTSVFEFHFFKRRKLQQLLLPPIWQPWRVCSFENQRDCRLLFPFLIAFFLWVIDVFAWSPVWRAQFVRLKLSRMLRRHRVLFRFQDSQILGNLL